ncbi:hypothetical protein ACQP2P_29060 [Dactylosporangium sp. CA-139114]|uniref:hypothetical protein n=1 Tax=Dactylosporangium sp. CA-139114 TaxID=3239931 RepID=UPI003D95A71A
MSLGLDAAGFDAWLADACAELSRSTRYARFLPLVKARTEATRATALRRALKMVG